MTSPDASLAAPIVKVGRRRLVVVAAGALGLGLIGSVTAGTSAALAVMIGMTAGVILGVTWSSHRARPSMPATSDMSLLVASTGPLGGVLRHCENAIVLTDSSLRIRYANEAFTELSTQSPPSIGLTIVEALAHRITDGDAFSPAASTSSNCMPSRTAGARSPTTVHRPVRSNGEVCRYTRRTARSRVAVFFFTIAARHVSSPA